MLQFEGKCYHRKVSDWMICYKCCIIYPHNCGYFPPNYLFLFIDILQVKGLGGERSYKRLVTK